MVRAYRYLYYRIYAWNLRAWGESDLPQYNVCLGLTLLSLVNLLSMLMLAGFAEPAHLKTVVLAIFAAVFLAHYLYFVRTGRYLELENEFRVQPLLAPLPGLAFVWGYVAGSLALFFSLLALRSAA